jgi:hypothetical protein
MAKAMELPASGVAEVDSFLKAFQVFGAGETDVG